MVAGGGIGEKHFAVPEGVVGEDDAAGGQEGQHEVEVGGVEAFVGIDEYEVEVAAEAWYDIEGIAYVEGDAAAVGYGGELGTDEVFEFVVDFDGVELCAVGEGFGHGERGVAGECAYLEDAVGAEHGDEHTEDAPLKVSAHHAWVYDVESRLACDAAEVVGLGVGMGGDVVVNQAVGLVGELVGLFECHDVYDRVIYTSVLSGGRGRTGCGRGA